MPPDIREQVRAALKARPGLSLTRLASLAGIHASTLSTWLNQRQKRRLGDQQLDRIAAALGARWRLVVNPERNVHARPTQKDQ